MKKLQYFLFPIILGINSIFLFSCSNAAESNNTHQAQLIAIHNFNLYKGIGLGAIVDNNSQTSRSLYSDENGEVQKQLYHLVCYTNRKSFIFLGFSKYNQKSVETDELFAKNVNYVLDKNTGKLYTLDFEENEIWGTDFSIGPESDGCILCHTRLNGVYGTFFLTIEDELLKLELIVPEEAISFVSYTVKQAIPDRFGNFLISDNNNGKYIINSFGKVKKVSTDLQLCINGIFYNSFNTNEITHWVNENGEYVSADYIPEIFISSMDNPAIYTEGQTSYLFNGTEEDLEIYRWDSYTDGTEETEYGTQAKEMLAIGKVSFSDDSKFRYTYEIVASQPQKYKNTYVSYWFNKTGKVLYISDDLSVVTFLDVMSGEYTDVLSLDNVLRVKSTENDKFGNIVISYVDNELNTINLYIDYAGNYSTTFKQPEFIIKYISPIN